MNQLIDITGQHFGEWVVLKKAITPKGQSKAHWMCRCTCGTKQMLSGTVLRSGYSKSCHNQGKGPRSRTPIEQRFWTHVNKLGPIHPVLKTRCWLWLLPPTTQGYGQIKDIDRKNLSVHRLSFTLHNGPIPSGLEVCHSCDNPLCVNPKHLITGTRQYNEADKVSKNRQATGEHNGQSKITTTKVVALRKLRAKGRTYDELASKFDIDRTTVAQIVHRKTWKHVT